jgi:transposase
MTGTACEADALSQDAGENGMPHSDPTAPPRRRANQRKGHGTDANDRPPIISVISRDTGEQRLWVCDHADRHTCDALMAENLPGDRSTPYTDARQSERGSHPTHATVCHGMHGWAREDAGENQREVHCHSCGGAGAALRTYLRAFRGIHKRYLNLYVVTYEAMSNTERVILEPIRRRCIGVPSGHTSCT